MSLEYEESVTLCADDGKWNLTEELKCINGLYRYLIIVLAASTARFIVYPPQVAHRCQLHQMANTGATMGESTLALVRTIAHRTSSLW